MKHFAAAALFSALGALLGNFAVQAQPKDPPKNLTNSIDMKFVWIAPGTFMMGSPNSEKGRGDDEIAHKVTFAKGFYMGVNTVTQEQWEKAMGNNPSEFKGDKNLPVDNVSWADCQDFIRKLKDRDKDKRLYRLPTEAEWEYCCRAGTTTPFYTGDTISTDQANYNGNFIYGNGKKGLNREKTVAVGSFPANAWGLHDMYGNVWQLCQDWHGGYQRADAVDPQGPKTGKNRCVRGGSWSSHPVFMRSANRTYADPETRTEYYGFRVCFHIE